MRAVKNEIKVETELGVGTRMSFVLPADFVDSADSVDADYSSNLHNKSGSSRRPMSGNKHDRSRPNPNGDANVFRICMADDHAMNYQILKRKFVVPGIQIQWEYFPNGESLLERFEGINRIAEEGEPDCGTDMILLDQNMGGDRMLGTDVCRQLRDKGITIPIIGLSGNDCGEPFFDAGADYVFIKPMNSSQCQFVCKQIARVMEGMDLEVLPARSTTTEALAASNFIFSSSAHSEPEPSPNESKISVASRDSDLDSKVATEKANVGIDLVTQAMYGHS